MKLRARLLAIDALLAEAHKTLNRIATEKIVNSDEARKAIVDLTRAREKLVDLAEEPTSN